MIQSDFRRYDDCKLFAVYIYFSDELYYNFIHIKKLFISLEKCQRELRFSFYTGIYFRFRYFKAVPPMVQTGIISEIRGIPIVISLGSW